MALDTNPLSTAETVAIDTAETVAIWKLPKTGIQRSFDTSFLLDPDAAIDYRIDIGVLDADTDEPSVEGDVTWFQGAVSKSKADSSDEIDDVRVTTQYIRFVITSAAAGGNEARIAFAVGRK